jgi:Flp pilus assembly protein TadG
MDKVCGPNRRRRGAALILLTLMIATIVIPMVGLAIDGTLLYIVKAKLSAAVDGGAIAAARSLSAGMTIDEQRDSAVTTADQFVRANFPNGFWATTNLRYDPPIDVQQHTTPYRRRTVTIQALVDVPLLFMRILGWDSTTVRAFGQAARRDVRLVLVLDRSSSMMGAMDAMKSAAIYFVNQFSEGRDELGLVVFGGSGIVAFPPRNPADPFGGTGPANNFKTASPSITDLIAMTNTGMKSSTGMADALILAWRELQKNPLPGALNAIVLFTDGRPNGITAEWNSSVQADNLLRQTSTCRHCDVTVSGSYCNGNPIPRQPALPMLGYISSYGYAPGDTTLGIGQLMTYSTDGHPTVQSWLTDGDMEPVVPSPNSDNCRYRINTDYMSQDVRAIPPADYYGNATNGGGYVDSYAYQAYHVALNLNQPNNGYHIGLASWNATDQAGYRIRHDANLGILIYSIGLNRGLWPPDPVLMLRLSNVNNPQNHTYESSLPEGLYVMAPSTSELNAAFAKVASEILRLSM